MDAEKFRWISCENTHILMRKDAIGQLAEWGPVGRVTLRQIYASVPPRWYAWASSEPHDGFLGSMDAAEKAKGAVETALNAR